jgi:hypothetical protein
MTPYQHCVSGFFVKQEEAELALTELLHRGIPAQQLALDVHDPQDLRHGAVTDCPLMLKNIRIDSVTGNPDAAAGDMALTVKSVTLFVASPLIAPLAMLGWAASLGASQGAVKGSICFQKQEGKLADLVADAIQSGQVVLTVITHSEQQTDIAVEVIQSAVGTYQDEARRRSCADF